MRVVACTVSGGAAEVTTTGAVWTLARDGTLEATQRIGCARPLLRLRAARGDDPWDVVAEGDTPAFVRGALEVRVRDDAVLELHARGAQHVCVEPLFAPEYTARHRGRRLVLDEAGGAGVYPLRARAVTRDGPVRVAPGDDVWVGVFPPREATPWRALHGLAHEGRPAPDPDGPYPSHALAAESAAAGCAVFCVHAYLWSESDPRDRARIGRYAGRPNPWRTSRHDPTDPRRFAALRDAVRAAGMEFVVYLSPQHSRAPDIVAEMRRVVREHDVDGLYLDGVAHDLVTLDRVVRAAREVLGPRRVLYLNASDQPFGTPRVHAPFVDARCDYVLRGDAGRGGLRRDTFLRFAVSGRSVSNAVGVWCHYGSAGRPVLRERMPPPDDVRACLAAGALPWRRAQAWREAGDDPAAFDAVVTAARRGTG